MLNSCRNEERNGHSSIGRAKTSVSSRVSLPPISKRLYKPQARTRLTPHYLSVLRDSCRSSCLRKPRFARDGAKLSRARSTATRMDPRRTLLRTQRPLNERRRTSCDSRTVNNPDSAESQFLIRPPVRRCTWAHGR